MESFSVDISCGGLRRTMCSLPLGNPESLSSSGKREKVCSRGALKKVKWHLA